MEMEMEMEDSLYMDYMYNNSRPMLLRLDSVYPLKEALPINGYFSPILILFTLITNIFVVVILLQRHMKSPTNTILAGMAISDTLTGLFPFPVFFYFFTLGHHKDYVEYNWCYVYKLFGEVIPIVFHSASIWLTVTLAVQRYIYICHSATARRWCTIPNVLIGTVVIYVIAILSQVTRFVDFEYIPVQYPSMINENKTVLTCVEELRPWVYENMDLYFNLYYWFRVIFMHCIPCITLVVLNVLLIMTLRTAQQRRMALLHQNKKSESKKVQDSNCTTLMLIAVVGLFLLVEFPLGIVMILFLIRNTFQLELLSDHSFQLMTLISNLFILLSYPLNFFIYCGMSRQFRQTFMKIFTKSPILVHREISHYASVPTTNGKMTSTETML